MRKPPSFPASCTGPLGKPSGPLGAPSTRDRAVDGSLERAVWGTYLPTTPPPPPPPPIPPPLPHPPPPPCLQGLPCPLLPKLQVGLRVLTGRSEELRGHTQVGTECVSRPGLGLFQGQVGAGWRRRCAPRSSPRACLMRRGPASPGQGQTAHHQEGALGRSWGGRSSRDAGFDAEFITHQRLRDKEGLLRTGLPRPPVVGRSFPAWVLHRHQIRKGLMPSWGRVLRQQGSLPFFFLHI